MGKDTGVWVERRLQVLGLGLLELPVVDGKQRDVLGAPLARQWWGDPPEHPPPSSVLSQCGSLCCHFLFRVSGGRWVSATSSSSLGVWDRPVPNGPVSIVDL